MSDGVLSRKILPSQKKKKKKFVKLLSLPVKQLKEEKHSGQRDDIK